MIKRGDNVRFLNAVGGGIVTRVDETKKTVYVEDADGFEMPVFERECVLIVAINKDTNFPVKDFKSKSNSIIEQSESISSHLPSPQGEGLGVRSEPIVETPPAEIPVVETSPTEGPVVETPATETPPVTEPAVENPAPEVPSTI